MLRVRQLLDKLMAQLQMAQIATILRTILIFYALLVFFMNHRAVFVFDSTHLHFPIPGLEMFASPLIVFLLGWVTLLSAIVGILKPQSRTAILVMGVSSFAFMLLTTEGRLAFSWYVPLSLIAIGIQTFYRSNPRPIFVFISAVYLIAAAHKAASFSDMLTYLPTGMRQIFVSEISSRPEVAFMLGQALAFSVVAVEIAMGSLFLFRRTRLYGFVLVCAFHSILTIVSSSRSKLADVGFSVLVVHAIAASSQIQFSGRDLIDRRYYWVWFTFLSATCLMFFGPPKGIVQQGAATVAILFPLMVIGFVGHLAKHRLNNQPLALADSIEVPRAALAAFTFVLLIWALTPKIIGHTNDHLGFAMFSYASHEQPFYCVDFTVDDASARCLPKRFWMPVIVRTRKDNSIQYCSRQTLHIERLQVWSQANCQHAPSASLYKIHADDPNGFEFLHQ